MSRIGLAKAPLTADGSAREIIGVVIDRTATKNEVVGRGTSRERFALILMGSFAAVSLALAALDLYGVLAYSVRQRTREIGVRIALGATAAQIRQLVLRQTTLFLSAGLVAGICGSLALGGFLKSLVFGISPTDPRILAIATVSLIASRVVADAPSCADGSNGGVEGEVRIVGNPFDPIR